MARETDKRLKKIKADFEKAKKLAGSVGLGKTPSGNTNVQTQIQTNTYNITQALADAYPEIRTAFELWKKKDYAGAEAAYLSSNFYKNNNATARERKTLAASQPGVYRDNLESYILATKQRLVRTGVRVDENTLRSIAKSAFDLGMNDMQVDQLVLKSGSLGSFGGGILGGIDALKGYAKDFGVSVGKSYWDSQATKLFAGETTPEDIQKEIRDLAKSAFPAYASYFDKGISLSAATSSTINLVARLMDVDPNTVTVDSNPIYRELIQYVNPETGQPEILPDYVKEKKVKADKRSGYFNTPTGTGVVNSLMSTSLSDMGLI